MGDPLSAGITAGGSLLGGIFGGVGEAQQAGDERRFAGEQAERDRIFQGGENAQDRALQERLARLEVQFQGDQAGLQRAQNELLARMGIEGQQAQAILQGGINERAQIIAQNFSGGQNELDRAFSERSGALDRQFQGEQANITRRGFARQAETLNQLIANEILQSDTTGLEAAASRTLTQGSRGLDSALSSRGIFNSGLALQGQTELAGGVLSNLARDINADQLGRAQLAGDLFSNEAFGFFDPTTGQPVNTEGPVVDVPGFQTDPSFAGTPVPAFPTAPGVTTSPVRGGPTTSPVGPPGAGGPTTNPINVPIAPIPGGGTPIPIPPPTQNPTGGK